MPNKKRYVQVGLGSRSRIYMEAVAKTYHESCEIVGLSDSNEGRARLAQRFIHEQGGYEPPIYSAEDFDRMIAETRPDTVIVTTKDSFHDYYLCRAMELGCDTITEKPMTIDASRCQRILDAKAKTGKKLTVTFNYRYAPPTTQVKDLLMSGVIGEVLSVEFAWLLDTRHGAEYFRRWHRNKENSGGLMVHKASHHFDLVNWWLSDVPETVYAMGHRKFYTPEMAARYGLANRAERCLECPESAKCPFYLDLREHPRLMELYVDNEQYDGYLRDSCVFGDTIDIEDSMELVVGYAGGAKMSYTLNAFLPWEGYTVSFNGTKGRLERKEAHSSYISGDDMVPHEVLKERSYIWVFPHFRDPYSVDVWTGEGGHGGGDPVLLDDIFSPNPKPDKYLRATDQRAGAYSILTGIAANQSMKTGQAMKIADLVTGIGRPDYPARPEV